MYSRIVQQKNLTNEITFVLNQYLNFFLITHTFIMSQVLQNIFFIQNKNIKILNLKIQLSDEIGW